MECIMVGPVGVEPTTYRLRAGCSAIELQTQDLNTITHFEVEAQSYL